MAESNLVDGLKNAALDEISTPIEINYEALKVFRDAIAGDVADESFTSISSPGGKSIISPSPILNNTNYPYPSSLSASRRTSRRYSSVPRRRPSSASYRDAANSPVTTLVDDDSASPVRSFNSSLRRQSRMSTSAPRRAGSLRPVAASVNVPRPRSGKTKKGEGFSYTLLWFPLMAFILGTVSFELATYVAVRQLVNILEYLWIWRGTKGGLRTGLRETKSYYEWKIAAKAMDHFMHKDEWKGDDSYAYYDHHLLRKMIKQMIVYRKTVTAFVESKPLGSMISLSAPTQTVFEKSESNFTGDGSGVRARIFDDSHDNCTSIAADHTASNISREPSDSTIATSDGRRDPLSVNVNSSNNSGGSSPVKQTQFLSPYSAAGFGRRQPFSADDEETKEQAASSALEKLTEVLIQGGVKSNVGGVENDWLYKHTYLGTKFVVEKFYEEVALSLESVANMPSNLMPTEAKRAFFRRADRAYGRTALCLSGGAAFGYYHLGVVKALFENGALPQVITGTSAGSLIASLICCRTDEELSEVLRPELCTRLNACGKGPIKDFYKMFRRYREFGAIFDANEWAEKTQWVTKGCTTFLEAYKRTGRILNITAVPMESHSPPKLLNYLTTPDTVIWTAVLASSAVPGVLRPVVLLNKTPTGNIVPFLGAGHKWRDGSLRTDIPFQELQQYFNVKYTIVSQVNPHIAVFFFDSRGSVGRPSSQRNGRGWRGGFVLAGMEHFLKLDLKKWLRVCRDLDLLPNLMQMDWSFLWLQKFDGNITILPKSSLSDFRNMINDPTQVRLERYITNGEKNTWPKIHMIRNRMLIERAIMKGMYKARREKRHQERYASIGQLSGLMGLSDDEKQAIRRAPQVNLPASKPRSLGKSRKSDIAAEGSDETLFPISPGPVLNGISDSSTLDSTNENSSTHGNVNGNDNDNGSLNENSPTSSAFASANFSSGISVDGSAASLDQSNDDLEMMNNGQESSDNLFNSDDKSISGDPLTIDVSTCPTTEERNEVERERMIDLQERLRGVTHRTALTGGAAVSDVEDEGEGEGEGVGNGDGEAGDTSSIAYTSPESDSEGEGYFPNDDEDEDSSEEDASERYWSVAELNRA